MTSTDQAIFSQLSAAIRRTVPAWPALLMLLLATLLGVLPPVPIDETRYLAVAWEMRTSSSWMLLHLNGLPYFDKPPLLFWLINLSWSVFGVSLWSARLLVLAFGAGCIELCRRLERRLVPGEAGQAHWLLLGALFFTLFSSVVMFDVMLCFFVLMAFLAIVRYVQGDGTRALLMLFIASSLGMLTKGPVMLLHLAAPILLARWWGAPDGTHAKSAAMLCVALLSVLPVLLWALIALRGFTPHDAWHLLMKQTTGRVVDSFAHNRPLWWYLPLLPLLLLPWPLLLRWRHLAPMAKPWLRSPAARFGLCASAPAFIAFCLISGKQVHYLLPLWPGAMLMLGALWRLDHELLSLRRMLILIAVAAVVLVWAILRPVENHRLPLVLYFLSAICIAVSAWLSWKPRGRSTPRIAAMASLLLTAALLPMVRHHVIDRMDISPLAHRVARLQREGVPIASVAGEPGLVTFIARVNEPIPQTDTPTDWAQQHPGGFVLIYAGHGHMPADLRDGIPLENGWVGLMPAQALAAGAPGNKPSANARATASTNNR